jgi:hypothetical protein
MSRRAAKMARVCRTEQLARESPVTLRTMIPGSPARHTVCRFCGLHAEAYGHASISECVAALEGETTLFRKQLRQREPRAPIGPATPMRTFRDRRLGVIPRP